MHTDGQPSSVSCCCSRWGVAEAVRRPRKPASSTAPTRAPSTAPTRAPSSASQGITYVDPQRYEVTYRVTAENTGFNVDRFLLYQPKPVGWDGQSKVHIESVMPTPTHAAADPIGNEIYSWDMSRIPSSGGDQAFVDSLHAYCVSDSYESRTQRRRSLRPFIEHVQEVYGSGALHRVRRCADQEARSPLAGGAADPLTLTRRFYDYVIDNSRYVLTGTGLHGAKALLESGKGECGDYAALFVALSRAAGIPARPVVGYWAKSGLDQTHVWAEFFVQGEGWVPVDPTMGQRVPADRDFYFGNMDNERVILNKGYNVARSLLLRTGSSPNSSRCPSGGSGGLATAPTWPSTGPPGKSSN